MNVWTVMVLVPAAVCVVALIPEVGRWAYLRYLNRKGRP